MRPLTTVFARSSGKNKKEVADTPSLSKAVVPLDPVTIQSIHDEVHFCYGRCYLLAWQRHFMRLFGQTPAGTRLFRYNSEI
jgi:hypothetical protein